MKGRELLPGGRRAALWALAAAGGAAFAAGLRWAPRRALTDLLLANFYFLGLAAATVAVLAIHHVARAGWPTLFRRVPEAMAAYLPTGAVLLAGVWAGAPSLYHWAHHGAAEHDAILHAKAGWLNLTAWAVRSALALALWWAFSRALVRNSRRQDESGDLELTARNRRLSAAFLPLFAATFTFAAIDWIMSLEPHWYSTLFPWYVFAGCLVHAFAGIAVLTLALKARGFFPELNAHHLHDLGKLLFGFSVFWAYLWFSQFLLIWYSNIPEETVYYAARWSRGWMLLQGANLLLNFLAPCALLLRSEDKKDASRLASAALVVCAGRWLDLYIMAVPSLGSGARPHWLDLPVFLGVAALFALAFERSFRSAAPIPSRDPYLEESLHHQG
ncbi:MAG: hypothetical protein HY554_02420 [Elusimicrobia bacterium]|nr:hypothetical protein [Elusimicrobiota bacterium]